MSSEKSEHAVVSDASGRESAGAVVAEVCASAGAEPRSYRMFDVRGVSGTGASFAGPVLFEKGEEFDLELRLPGDEVVRARVRVTDLERGDHDARMQVAFVALGDEQRKLLDRLAAGAAGA